MSLCVIGLAPTHVAFKDEGESLPLISMLGNLIAVGLRLLESARRKNVIMQNAQHLESNSALCKVCSKDATYIVRCCVKGSLLEVNDRLIKQPELLNSAADREGYIAIIMPKPADWLKVKDSLVGLEEYKKLREV
ncbi:Curculin-like mannose-binding lectin family protein [Prunus dulcis]|uniref:Protein Abitram n=1 Tax=Prunus dulcis TaxID=3755 RepID=A0A4Y1QWG4_PRUDU|nr:Curculin-like mannose-binding lectin family protein [Prunus dulcis]